MRTICYWEESRKKNKKHTHTKNTTNREGIEACLHCLNKRCFFQTLPKTVHEEHSFKWKHQSYLIHELRNATENTLELMESLAKEPTIHNNRSACKTQKITPTDRSVEQHKLEKNYNSIKKLLYLCHLQKKSLVLIMFTGR